MPVSPVTGSGRSIGETTSDTWREIGSLLTGYGLPFLLVLYLGLEGGGYDIVVRSEVGIILWWIVLIGCLVGSLPTYRVMPAAWIGFGLLGAFAAWTALGLTWTDSTASTMTELSRVLMLLGVLTLSMITQGRENLRRTVSAIGAAVAVIALVALASRIQPDLVSSESFANLLSSSQSRLSHPLGYWNGLAAVLAMGAPLLLWSAVQARTVVARALGAAALPAIFMASFLTFSRGGVLAMAVALVVLVALMPGRLGALPTLINVGLGSIIVVAATAQRQELADGFTGSIARSQGDELLVILLFVSVGVALVQAAIATALRSGIVRIPSPPRNYSLIAAGSALIVALLCAMAFNLPGEANDRWSEFKENKGTGQGAARLDSSSGNGRYQFWQAATDQYKTSPLEGGGPGTYEFWWAREGTTKGFVRDAHSLYLETLGETGIVGAALIAAFLVFALTKGIIGSLRQGSSERRSLLAAAVASGSAFLVAAAVDWAWEMTVIPVILLLLFGALLGPSSGSRRGRRSRFDPDFRGWPLRIGFCVLSAAAIVAIAIPMSTTSALRESQAAFRDGQPTQALDLADKAARIQPSSPFPEMQRALVLESYDRYGAALVAARAATRADPVNWRPWLVRSRIAAQAGQVNEALTSFRRGRALNPRSSLFR